MAGAIHGTAITLEGRQVGTVESIDLWHDQGNAARVNIVVKASFGDFPATVDRYLGDRGFFQNRCSRRIYWVGDTAVLEAGPALRFSSKVRYEQWACSSLGNARLLRDTRSVHWSVSVPRAPIDQVAVIATLDDIVDFPDGVERMFGLRVREEIPMPLPPECGNVRLCSACRVAAAGVRGDRLLLPDWPHGGHRHLFHGRPVASHGLPALSFPLNE